MGGQLGDFTIDQVAGASALILGSVGALLMVIFKSRCETISCCWGLWACKRSVQTDDTDTDTDTETLPL